MPSSERHSSPVSSVDASSTITISGSRPESRALATARDRSRGRLYDVMMILTLCISLNTEAPEVTMRYSHHTREPESDGRGAVAALTRLGRAGVGRFRAG